MWLTTVPHEHFTELFIQPDFREFQGYLVAGELNGLQTQRVYRQTVSVCKQINGRLCFPRVAALKICSPTPR
jgi:hypothetical protein